MTLSHLILMASLYLLLFVGVAHLTRATVARIAGAICGGAVFAVVALLALALGERQGWWRVPIGALRTSGHYYGSVLRVHARQSI